MSRATHVAMTTASAVAAAMALAACGSGARLDAGGPSGTFPVQVSASFPTVQRLSEHTAMVVTVRNTGTSTIPDVAVTVTEPAHGTAVQAFGEYFPQADVASHSRAVWIIDKPPGRCAYSCANGGAGSAGSDYANTWALGQLKPGATATFRWAVTAVQPGSHAVAWTVSAGLSGKAVAKDSTGVIPRGSFSVRISSKPAQAAVLNNGQIVVPGGAGGVGSGGTGGSGGASASPGG